MWFSAKFCRKHTTYRWVVCQGVCYPSYRYMAKNPAAVALGRLTSAKKAAASAKNAKKATAARMKRTPKERQDQARAAALARWKKR